MHAMPSLAAAQTLARELLEPLGNRWAHTQAVAARAHELSPAVTLVQDRQLLVEPPPRGDDALGAEPPRQEDHADSRLDLTRDRLRQPPVGSSEVLGLPAQSCVPSRPHE